MLVPSAIPNATIFLADAAQQLRSNQPYRVNMQRDERGSDILEMLLKSRQMAEADFTKLYRIRMSIRGLETVQQQGDKIFVTDATNKFLTGWWTIWDDPILSNVMGRVRYYITRA